MKTIAFSLSASSIGQAIHELRAYREDFKQRCEALRRMVAERIRWSAENGFRMAVVSDVIFGQDTPNDVTVTAEDRDNITVVIASGTQAIFIEFGAGVYHNGGKGMIGQSPHPWGAERGFAIGMYGKGHGQRNAWGYTDGGTLTVTRGTPAAMPMYRGMQEAILNFASMVREVFG